MEIIEATWERRNLGVNAFEFRLSRDDTKDIANIINQLSQDKYKNAYLIFKIPVASIEALHALEDYGFRYMETQFHMFKNLEKYTTPEMISHFKNILKQEEIAKNREDWKSITDLMTNNMFHTDRIYLDPKLPEGTSCKRYQNWIMDLVNNPEAHLFVYYYKENPMGFGLVKMSTETKIVDDLLEGIFEKYQDMGLGCMMFDTALRSYQNYGMKKLSTCISSNNPAIVNLDLAFGYSIRRQEYILRKYDKGDI